ncbi:MAG: hypothetical protein ABIF09_10985 [Gemmatimonadota bacterium]
MIINKDPQHTAPGWLRTALRVCVVCVLPLGLVHCGSDDEPGSLEPELAVVEAAAGDLDVLAQPCLARIDAGVAAGRIPPEAAARMRTSIDEIKARSRGQTPQGSSWARRDDGERSQGGIRAA